MNNLIKKYILEVYPEVYQVDFRKTKVQLVSDEGRPTIERTDVIITLNNSKNEFNKVELDAMRKRIFLDLDETFNLGLKRYGSVWELYFRQLAIVHLSTPLVISDVS